MAAPTMNDVKKAYNMSVRAALGSNSDDVDAEDIPVGRVTVKLGNSTVVFNTQ